ncbi:fasciclin domain-containing protein [Brumimicrobium glaciale]|nr:fasciclin domain-containing protein [Brumimicrobium glaciale]
MKTILSKTMKNVSLTLALAMMGVTAFGQTVYGVISNSPNHTTLKAAIDAAGLQPTLDDPMGDFTVFAPDNDAFSTLLDSLGITAPALLASADLDDILTYHVLAGTVNAADIMNGDIVTPLNAMNTLKLTVTLTPEVFINHAKVDVADISATNGVVHSIDAVLLADETVADVAIDNGFSTLVTAVVEARLLPALTNPLLELTVFAPSNMAFTTYITNSGISEADLLASPALANILLYHVLGMEVMSNDLTNGLVTTLNGADVLVDITSGVMINDAAVTLADVDADNGVVHAIDKILVPGTASVENLEMNQIAVYPNPTTSLIKVENFENAEYKIVNAAGMLVQNDKMNLNTINVETLDNGMYYLFIMDGEKTFTSQFIKE